jgi:nitrate reductase NapD
MNISSAVIKTQPGKSHEVEQELVKRSLCEVHQNEANIIVITIEGADVNEEVSKLRTIEKLKYVMSAEMIYSYAEEELEQERGKIELSENIPDWLNDENISAKNIPYNGNLKKKF